MRIRISEEQHRDIRQWFVDFTEGFRSLDPEIQRNIEIKKLHTRKVCREILDIGEKLGLDGDELRLAEIIALLHDTGRFPQYAHYGTFKDSESENHASLGIRVIKDQNVLASLDELPREIILHAVTFHNRLALPGDGEEPFIFYQKLIRDADKLDIWRVVLDYYYRRDPARNNAIELDFPDSPGYSARVIQDLRNEKIVDMTHVRNMNDFKLLQMGWIFDINFTPTRERIAERRYLQRLRAVLPPSDEIDTILDKILGILLNC